MLKVNKKFSNVMLILAGILIGLLVGQSNAFFGLFDFPPSDRQSEFVKICGDLNSQKLTAENIRKPEGWCYLGGDFTKCGEENIRRLKDGTDPFFVIYQKRQVDNIWHCSIDNMGEDKIKAIPYYQYE